MEKNKERLYEVIRKPLITEKGTLLSSENKILFEIAKDATKLEIKEAVEFLFKVEVTAVNTLNQNGKTKVFKGRKGRRRDFKKAIVTLKEGQNIDLAAGI